jgi:hypothetical protein
MAFKPLPPSFKDASGRRIDHTEHVIDEPISPAVETLGPSVALTYTPRGLAGERYIAARVAGPTGQVRVEISTDGGTGWDTEQAVGAAGVAESILVRDVALPFAGNDSEQTSLVLGVVADAGEADWLG